MIIYVNGERNKKDYGCLCIPLRRKYLWRILKKRSGKLNFLTFDSSKLCLVYIFSHNMFQTYFTTKTYCTCFKVPWSRYPRSASFDLRKTWPDNDSRPWKLHVNTHARCLWKHRVWILIFSWQKYSKIICYISIYFFSVIILIYWIPISKYWNFWLITTLAKRETVYWKRFFSVLFSFQILLLSIFMNTKKQDAREYLIRHDGSFEQFSGLHEQWL